MENLFFVFFRLSHRFHILEICPSTASTLSFLFLYLPHRRCVFERCPQHLKGSRRPEPHGSSPSLNTNQSGARPTLLLRPHTSTHTPLPQHHTLSFVSLFRQLQLQKAETVLTGGRDNVSNDGYCASLCRNSSRKNSVRRTSCSGRPVNTSVMSLQQIKSR